MGITITERAHFNGKTGAALPAGETRVGADTYTVGGQYNAAYYHGRYTILTDAGGAARIAVGGLRRSRANNRRLRLDVTAGAATHRTSGGGGVTLDAQGAGVIEAKLLPNTSYCVWLYCDGWCDLFSDAGLTLTASGSYGTPGTPAAPDGWFGRPLPIAIAGGSAGARYTVTVSCAGRTETLQTEGTATDLLWTPAVADFAPLIPAAPGAEATIRCETFYAGVSAGTAAATAMLRFAPGSLPPTLSPGWAVPGYDNSGTAAANIAAWVQGHSRAAVSFDASKIACAHGASVTGYTVVCGTETLTAAPFRTAVLTGTAATLVCTVTDSRGQSARERFALTLHAYAPPVLTAVSVVRCDQNGEPDENGDVLVLTATAAVSPLGGLNPYTLTAYSRDPGGSWIGRGTLPSGTAYPLAAHSPDQTWEVKLTLTDALGGSASWEQRVPPRRWAMKFRPDGEGVGFGKAPEHGGALELPEDWCLRFGRQRLHPAMLGAQETGDTAAAAHAAGEYFIWRERLVCAGAAIAVGDALAGATAPTSAAAALTAQAAALAAQGSTLAAHTAALGRLSCARVTLDDQTAPAGTYSTFTLNAARPGHTPLGVLGFSVANASTGGTHGSFVSPYQVLLNGTSVTVAVRNHHASTDARIRLDADVLYI